MGCCHTKAKSSHYSNRQSWNQRKPQTLSTLLRTPKNSTNKSDHEQDFYRPSQDIFTVAAYRMSTNEPSLMSTIDESSPIIFPPAKKFKIVDGQSQPIQQNVSNISVVEHNVNRQRRGKTLDSSGRFRGCIVWFTGLSASGKSTISMGVEDELVSRGIACYCLDGDNLRAGLCKGLGFSLEDRKENIRRAIEAAKLQADGGTIVLCSLVSPMEEDRQNARQIATNANLPFFEVHVNTSIEDCIKRDPKKLYKKALAGEIKNFTGVGQSYEVPENPELSLSTVDPILGTPRAVEACVGEVIKLLKDENIIPACLPAKINGDNRGCPIKELFVENKQKEYLTNKANELYAVNVTKVDLQWIQVLSEGWASPLTGFMREEQYLQCLHFKCHLQGEISNQSIPIVLAIDDEDKKHIEKKSSIALKYHDSVIAILQDVEVFPHHKENRICMQFATSHKDHPYIKIIERSGNWLIGGDLKVFERIKWNDGLDEYRLTPNELKEMYQKMNSDVVFAFQLRNPIHNGHALLIKDCQDQLKRKGYRNPTLLLHPLGGWTKEDDVPLHVRINQHKAILEEGVLDKNSTILAIFPSPMMYAGPTEVQWHAKARLVAGANFYIVGRDPAGIKHPGKSGEDLYDSAHGGRVLAMAPGLQGMTILKFKPAAFDKKHGKMDFFDEKRKQDFLNISGTEMRNYAKRNQTPPDGFMAPKAWAVLANYYSSIQGEEEENGVCKS